MLRSANKMGVDGFMWRTIFARILVCFVAVHGAAYAEEPFKFIALGDMPYGPAEDSYPPFERLIAEVNRQSPAFTIHVGDIKSGSTPCSDQEFQNQLNFMNRFENPLIYTPGDNEWTDCHREKAGGYDPLERLFKLRELFFSDKQSQGKSRMLLVRQNSVHGHLRNYVENARWWHNGVQFVTVHVVGSNNNFQTRTRRAANEFFDRTTANQQWLTDSFMHAKRTNALAVVVAMHADLFGGASKWTKFPAQSGFSRIARTLMEEAVAFGKPVLLIHGDSHILIIDKPFSMRDLDRGRPQQTIENLTRLQVFGASEVHAVEVSVDPNAPNPFGFRPIYGPRN